MDIIRYREIPSTNTRAKELGMSGASDGTVVIAERQSAGRGRMGRSFFSPDGTGLYMSILVRRPLAAADATRLTTAAALAVAEAIEALLPVRADIKWVNDIYIGGRKVCGILTEGAVLPGSASLDFAVVGIGVNVAPPEGGFPAEIAEIATSLLPTQEGAKALRDALEQAILSAFVPLLEQLHDTALVEQYRRRCIVPGRDVTVLRADGASRAAHALDIDGDFRLVVRYEDGEVEALGSGEVSVRW